MQNSKCVGKALYDMYLSRFGECMDEMKMHKLMYFAQRESLMDTDCLTMKFHGNMLAKD